VKIIIKFFVFCTVLVFSTNPSLGEERKFEHIMGPTAGFAEENGGHSSIYFYDPDIYEKKESESAFSHSLKWVGFRLETWLTPRENDNHPPMTLYFESGAFIGQQGASSPISHIDETGLFAGVGGVLSFVSFGFRYYSSTGSYNGMFQDTSFSGHCRLNRYMGELRINFIISPVLSFGSRSFKPVNRNEDRDAPYANLRNTDCFSWMLGIEFDLTSLLKK